MKLWSRRSSTSSPVRPSAQRRPWRRHARRRTATSKSPTFQPVRTSGSAARTWARKRARQRRSSANVSIARDLGGPEPDQQDAVPTRARRGDGIDLAAVQAGLEVEGQDAQPGHEVGRLQVGIPVDAADPGPALEGAGDGEAPADAAIDQVAVREAEVGLEALHPRFAEAAAQGRDVGGQPHVDAGDGVAGERGQRRGRDGRLGRGAPDEVGGVRRDEEVGRQAVVDDQGGLAGLQDRVEVHFAAVGPR